MQKLAPEIFAQLRVEQHNSHFVHNYSILNFAKSILFRDVNHYKF